MKKISTNAFLQSRKVKKWFLMMKLTMLLFLAGFMQVSATVYSQATKFNFRAENKQVVEVLKEIEESSDFRFFYIREQVDVEQKVTVLANGATVEQILDELFAGQGISYKVMDDNLVLLSPDVNIKKMESVVSQQQNAVSGKVTDVSGLALPGVTVIIKGTTNGTVTDASGVFSFSNLPENAVLQFSFVGMKSVEVEVGTQTSVNVSMVDESIGLEEVVAIGYGTKAKGALTGAVSTARGEVLESRPVVNTLSGIQGVMPGVTVTRSSGRPGQENYNVQIRGFSSKNGNQPLILIDGVAGDLNTLNPNDIETITVLKDAAAAIYGARAADGVMLVTTKSGTKGKTTVTYSGNIAVKSPSYVKNMASPYQLAKMFDEGRANDGDPLKYLEEDYQKMLNNTPGPGPGRMLYLEGYPQFYQDVDWANEVFKNSLLQSHNVAVNGGNEQIRFMVSGGYLSNDGVFAYGENNSKRYNLRSNITIKIRENITLDSRMGFEYENYVEPAETEVALGAVLQSWSYLPVYNPAGHFYEYQGYANPAQWLTESGENGTATQKFRSNTKLDWEIIDGLTLTGQAGFNMGNVDSKGFWKTFKTYDWDDKINTIRRSPNFASYVDVKDYYGNLTGYLNYQKVFGNHSVGAMVGLSHEEYDIQQKVMEGREFPNNEVYPLTMANPTKLYATSRGIGWRIEDWALNSYFGRFSYSYSGKYYLDATFRKDGSSKFSPDYRWSKTFPAISAAWKISEEGFMSGQGIFDLLKIRGSYGQSGNQDIRALGTYDYVQLITIGGKYPMGTSNSPVSGASMKGMASPDRTWETIQNINFGIDYAFLNSRLFGSFDFYQKKNTNMLVDVTFPTTLGATAPSTNSGELTTKGWDWVLNWADKAGDFSYKVGVVINHNENELTDLEGADQFNLGLTSFREGYPINSYFGYKTEGIIKNQQDLDAYSKYAGKGIVPATKPNGQKGLGIGDIMYKDVDGDGAITPYGDRTKGYMGDAVYLGSANPNYNYGFTAEMNYKGFDFSMLWQGTGKKLTLRTGEFAMPYFYPWFQPYEYFYEKTWAADRQDAKYPRISHTDAVKYYNYTASDMMIENTAYLRLKNLQIGYTLPKSLAGKLFTESVRVYFSGEDLLEFTKGDWEGNYDPEEGQSFNTYPFYRAYSFGIDVKF